MYTQTAVLDESAQVVIADLVKADEPNLIAENIKDGVTILGVTGTYTGQ